MLKRQIYFVTRQVRSFKFPKREKMDALKNQWIEECGFTPVGNVQGSEWASGSKDAKVRRTMIAVNISPSKLLMSICHMPRPLFVETRSLLPPA